MLQRPDLLDKLLVATLNFHRPGRRRRHPTQFGLQISHLRLQPRNLGTHVGVGRLDSFQLRHGLGGFLLCRRLRLSRGGQLFPRRGLVLQVARQHPTLSAGGRPHLGVARRLIPTKHLHPRATVQHGPDAELGSLPPSQRNLELIADIRRLGRGDGRHQHRQ